ncbi:hypothetical protein C8R43DRAFT_1115675 [Mycena crocata]|nr:hypothetical protein C8R43DRAFT_1115675 [Mycena crocata]
MSHPWPKTIMHPFAALPERALDADYFAPYNKLLYHLFPADTNFLVAPGPYPPRSIPASNNTAAGAGDAGLEFTVFYNDLPVLLLHITSPELLRWPSARAAADAAARRRLRDLVDLCPLPKLYAVSAFGTKVRFYAAVAGEGIDPPVNVWAPSYPRTDSFSSNSPNSPNSPASATSPHRVSTSTNGSGGSSSARGSGGRGGRGANGNANGNGSGGNTFSNNGFGPDPAPLNRWNSDILDGEGANLLKQSVAEIIARIYLTDAYE